MDDAMDFSRKTKKLLKLGTNIAGSPKFEANIDALDGGVLYGWARNRHSASPISVNVLRDGKVIGHGMADCFRKDLQEAGFFDGKHAFEIDLCDLDFSVEHELSLVEAHSLAPIKHPRFLTQIAERVALTVTGIEHGQLLIDIDAKSPVQGHRLVVSENGDTVCEADLHMSGNSDSMRVGLPVSVLDGKEHPLAIHIKGKAQLLALYVVKSHPVQTPWHYIKSSCNTPGFLSRHAQADSRYESLKYQLDALVNRASQFDIENIQTLHNVLLQSFEDRSSFPPFELPCFDNPAVSIIVPAYNKFALTYHCIASIAFAYTRVSYEVILADDCSTDETEEAESIIKNLVVSRNKENLRFLRNCNEASSLASGEYIVFLNNDTEVTSFWLDELVSMLDHDASTGMTGSKLLNRDGTLQEAGGIVWQDGQPWNVGRNANAWAPEFNYTRQVDYLTGAAMCIRRDLWESVGRFSEEYVPCYYEDADLAFKVREAGYKTVYVPGSVVFHYEGQSHGTDVTKGLKRYQAVNEKAFRNKWFKDFRNNGKASPENLKIEKDRGVDQRVLVLDYATPQPDKDAGGYAAVQEIKLMLALGFKVTFVPANLAHMGKYTLELQKMGVEVVYSPFYASVYDVIDKRIEEMNAVYITRYHIAQEYMDYIKDRASIPVLFNNADLHFLRELRAALKHGRDEAQLAAALVTRDNELGVCRKADAILCYNLTEHAVIASHILEAEKLHLTPWVLDKKPEPKPFHERAGIVFLGGYNHSPNIEAVEFLVEHVMPIMEKQRPDIHLSVYGSNMPDSFKKHEAQNVHMLGYAESLDDVFQNSRIFVAPLFSGAGIKGKVLEAMAYGVPTIVTDVAAEGTGLTREISASFAETADQFVKEIIRLYDDESLWNAYSTNELKLAQTKYSFDSGVANFKDIFASVGVFSSQV